MVLFPLIFHGLYLKLIFYFHFRIQSLLFLQFFFYNFKLVEILLIKFVHLKWVWRRWLFYRSFWDGFTMVVWARTGFNLWVFFLIILVLILSRILHLFIKSLLFATLSLFFRAIRMLILTLIRWFPTLRIVSTINDLEALIGETTLIIFLILRPLLHKLLIILFFLRVLRVPKLTWIIFKFIAYLAIYAPVFVIILRHYLY